MSSLKPRSSSLDAKIRRFKPRKTALASFVPETRFRAAQRATAINPGELARFTIDRISK